MIWRLVTISVYVLIGLTLVGVELAARRGSTRVPTGSALVRWALRRRSTQIGLLLAWWWLGWHFVTAG